MKTYRVFQLALLTVLTVASIAPGLGAQGTDAFVVRKHPGRMDILFGESPVATYVWEDPKIPRPYFCQVTTLQGIPVSRTSPPDPIADRGNEDHPEFHPGIWLAFGDLNGMDFWRNRARVRHDGFAMEPEANSKRLQFAVRNVYETLEEPATAIAEEHCTYSFQTVRNGVLLVTQTEIKRMDGALIFGDQEEMGFGVRMATKLRVKGGGGHLVNSRFGRSEAGIWGKTADWCAGDGRVGDRVAGMMVMPGPENFRPSWFHVRDYGLILANPFGKKAMTGPDDPMVFPDHTERSKGTPMRLSFGVYIFDTHWTRTGDYQEMYIEFLKCLKSLPEPKAAPKNTGN
ncbi:MAG: PmoA family protein [Candidatus Hydrogenedentes bacterium]|nr:PmoA family protein [Candidatus Hydrogenedentota bacterium]